MTAMCGEAVEKTLLPEPRHEYRVYMPRLNCSYAEWGAVMNDGRRAHYVTIWPASAIKCLKEIEP